MNLTMINALAATAMSLGERVAYSLRMLVVGLGMVFVVLAILWGVLALSRIFLHDMPARRRAEESGEKKAVQAKPAAAPAPAPVKTPAPAAQNDGALIAVITAAISAAMAEEGTTPAGGFRVVSFRRVSGNHAWNRK